MKEIRMVFFAFILHASIWIVPECVHSQNIAVNTTGTAAGANNMFEVTQASAINNTVGIAALHSGAATNAYAIWAQVTAGVNKYAIVVPFGGGNVGIGTISPTQLLELKSAGSTTGTNIKLFNSSPLAVGNLIYQTYTFEAGQHAQFGMIETDVTSQGHADFYWSNFDASLAERMRLTSSGNLGIGTSAPTSVLHTVASGVKTAAYTGNTLTNTATNNTVAALKIGLDVSSTGVWTFAGAVNTGLNVSVSGGTTNYAATFQGGNVGIGTTAPNTSLDVNGAIAARLTTAAAANAITIPDNVSFFKITSLGGVQTNACSVANPKQGQILTIVNVDGQAATFAGFTIPATNGIAKFVYDSNSSTWRNIANSTWGSGGWLTTGNSGLGASNFLGTIDDVDLKFKVNNQNAGIITSFSGFLYSTAFGYWALNSNVSGQYNAAFGYQSLGSALSGSNTAIGANSLATLTRATQNVAIGAETMAAGMGYVNGGFAFATDNIAIGYAAMMTTNPTNSSNGYRNIGIGTDALRNNTTGSYNLGIGYQAGYSNSTGNGNICIGYQAGYSETGSDKLYIDNSNTTTPLIYGDFSANRIGINCNNPQYPLHVVGNLGVVGTIYATAASVSSGVSACSDIRYKKEIITLTNSLDKILTIRGVSYFWKTKEFPEKNFTDDKQLGFIAQEIEKIYPEVVFTDKDGYKSVDYSRLTPVLVEAMKEQQIQINELRLMIEKLMNKDSADVGSK